MIVGVKFGRLVQVALAVATALTLQAQQKGQYVPGQQGLNPGLIPDSGITYANMAINYSASKLNDSSGNHRPNVLGTYSFWADENILFYVPKAKIFGGNFAPYIVLTPASGSLVAGNLTTIYITHGHGDHWFGVATLLERFPEARVVATRDTIEVMQLNASPKMLDGAWKPGFPGQIPDRLQIAEELRGNVIELEGQVLQVIELGHTDTEGTTCLYVPSIGLIIAGDSVYNSVHLYLAESTTESRREWIAALDKIESLRPTNVVASHKMPENQDDPANVAATRQYIKDFDRLLHTTSTAQEFYAKMLELHPGRINRGWALWGSIRAFKS
jgi:glyoxylase-like metal-dependent hydrolase (beta-lactamase superfamily II)